MGSIQKDEMNTPAFSKEFLSFSFNPLKTIDINNRKEREIGSPYREPTPSPSKDAQEDPSNITIHSFYSGEVSSDL